MGKIVKYCNSCDESFTEKFGFCPTCGKEMDAFEMKPVDDKVHLEALPTEEFTVEEVATEEFKAAQVKSDEPILERNSKSNEVVLIPLALTPIAEAVRTEEIHSPDSAMLLSEDSAPEISEHKSEVELTDEVAFEDLEPIARPNFSIAGSDSGLAEDLSEEKYDTTVDYSDFKPIDSGQNDFAVNSANVDRDFHITVLTEKNVKQRNLLLLGSMVLMITLCVGAVIGSIFNHKLFIGSIGEDELSALVPIIEQTPMAVEKEEKRKADEDAGGGGGGGRDEATPTSKGRLANQTPNPLINPDVSIIQRKSELQLPVAATQGKDLQREPSDDPYGDPNSIYGKLSNGMGTGGGQGSGSGTGQGSGRGTGQGSGIGSGIGNGVGDGRGGGTGSGTDGDPPDVKPKPVGPTTAVKFISKPQPKYTDAARQNNVQGNVVLRITFLSNGQIGSISPVSGLSYGLTEQAIAAARQIRFEPAMKNGQPQSVTKSVQYSFTIY